MTNESFTVNNEFTIQRCPHNEENPYTQISRALIRDDSIRHSEFQDTENQDDKERTRVNSSLDKFFTWFKGGI